MKLKKYSYIIVLILMLTLGINGVNAVGKKTCYYMSNDNNFKSTLKLQWGHKRFLGMNFDTLDDYAKVSVDKIGENKFDFDTEPLVNWWDGGLNNWYDSCITGESVCFEPYYKNETAANKDKNPDCPRYLVFQYCKTYYVWGTESKTQAEKAVQNIRNAGCTGYYASTEKNGQAIDQDTYYSEFKYEGILDIEDIKELTCEDYESVFGSKDDPDSIRYMLESVLQYVRIIVPILIILFGTLDFGKAVIAGKEDAMKKAQTDFIKRVLIGVAVFFVPLLVDVVMDLAEIVWNDQYIHCGF